MSNPDAFSSTAGAEALARGSALPADPPKAKRQRRKTYVPTPEEQRVVDRLKGRAAERPRVPKWNITETGPNVYEVKCEHPDAAIGQALTMAAFGIGSPNMLASVLNSLVETTKVNGVPSDAAFQRLYSMLASLEPKDEKELLLCVEMVCVHDASMAMSAQVRRAVTDEQQITRYRRSQQTGARKRNCSRR